MLMKMFYLLTGVDLYSTGVPGHLGAEVRLVYDTGALLVHHIVRREGLDVRGLCGGGAGGERLVQEVSLVQQVAGTVTPTTQLQEPIKSQQLINSFVITS